MLLLIYSGLTDYWIAGKIAAEQDKRKRKRALAMSIVNNLALLYIFKYLNATVDNINEFLQWTPMAFRLINPDIVLPVGISFYTFQTMSYSFDVYRKKVEPLNRLDDFMLYVAFFPQLVAGPILRANQFVPQLKSNFVYSSRMFFAGVFLVLFGMMKKMCIADPLGIYLVDPVFRDSSNCSSLEILVAVWSYGLQLYNDFSGYSDIAIGSAMILGFRIPINFDSPLLCTNATDFWNRWHISLGHWVRDYVFYPFNSFRFFKKRIRLNLFVTILLIGVWHGPRWTYFYFGVLHGLLAVLHSKYKNVMPIFHATTVKRIWKLVCWIVFYQFLGIGFLLFRADDMGQAARIVNDFLLFSANGSSLLGMDVLFCLLLGITTHFVRAKRLDRWGESFSAFSMPVKIAITLGFILLFYHSEFLVQGERAFIYFQF